MCRNDPVEVESIVSVADVDGIIVEDCKDTNKVCLDWFVAAAADCWCCHDSNIGVEVDFDGLIVVKVGDSVDIWGFDEIDIEDKAVDGDVFVFVDVADSDDDDKKEEEDDNVCGDWLFATDVDWRKWDDSDVGDRVDVDGENESDMTDDPIVPDEDK